MGYNQCPASWPGRVGWGCSNASATWTSLWPTRQEAVPWDLGIHTGTSITWSTLEVGGKQTYLNLHFHKVFGDSCVQRVTFENPALEEYGQQVVKWRFTAHTRMSPLGRWWLLCDLPTGPSLKASNTWESHFDHPGTREKVKEKGLWVQKSSF